MKQPIQTAILALGLALPASFAHSADITVAGGCFWCVEADFEKVSGVSEAVSGYTGGTTSNPTYKQVTGGNTGHYEAVRITYDADTVSRERLFDLFFRSIDPFDDGGQFCDRGASYRPAIFVEDAAERADAEAAKTPAEQELGRDVAVPILDAKTFYEAEDYHQGYYKSTEKTLTRFGYIDRADAYDRYREGCRRDQRVRQVWGDDAPFIGG
ncbi:peptide-methionine (S)-S-oxide reductase MsrA [Roseivivax sp. THAF197b]|uniref:peptide-methionine (S)-S-oxide reductase MsrA n=1 Tax=Roseivivax sp. THAF197b TaxID=2588299 RepID=UPI001268C2B3|nr:peptide-methionine (S)-S-oxide reductase MsrA [Roseivivax sp. THAF197b]QFS84714.1 Peptide methionine sulfoxide reductase MsrA [Roseivivax sp. THAF197b]